MNANQIRNIIENIDSLPYQTVFINGPWGVGKTYELNTALSKREDVYSTSLFGMKGNEDIYKALAWNIKIKNDRVNKIKDKVAPLAEMAMKKYNLELDFASVSKQIINNHFNGKTNGIIVFDDLERINDGFSIESFFGFIEELRNTTQSKIIIVANLSEFTKEHDNSFQKYSEKVIDKTYNIDHISINVDWNELGIDEHFIIDFVEQHKLNNLRTIKKANQFYCDVFKQIKNYINDDSFLNIIKNACYAIVVEDIEKIYLNYVIEELKKFDGKDYKSVLYKSYKENEVYRIENYYLSNTGNFSVLVNVLLNYYKNNTQIDINVFNSCYEIFKKAGEKDPFYKSDEELNQMLDILLMELYNNNSVLEAVQKIDLVGHWMNVLEKDIDKVFENFKKYILKYIEQNLLEGNDVNLDLFSTELKYAEARELVVEINEMLPRKKVEILVRRINEYVSFSDYSTAYNCMRDLEQERYLYNGDRLKELLLPLLNEGILPKGSLEDLHWRYIHRLYKVCSESIYDELLAFTNRAIENAESKVLKFRMTSLRKQYLYVE